MTQIPVSRRNVFAYAGAVLASSAVPRALAQDDPEISDELASQILYEESEGERQFTPRALLKPFWFQQEVGKRPSPTWPTDNVSFDYAHLAGHSNSDEPFKLTPDVLAQLLA